MHLGWCWMHDLRTMGEQPREHMIKAARDAKHTTR